MGFVLTHLAITLIDRWFPHLRLNGRETRPEQESRAYLSLHLALLEAGERDDYQAALALERGEPVPPPTHAQLEMRKASFAALFEKFLVADKLSPWGQPGTDSTGSNSAVSSEDREQARVECVICCDTFDRITCLDGACGHFICPQCVISMAEVGSRDEGLLPLKCCQQPLPMHTLLGFLPGPLRASFSVKCAEAATPPDLRVYCPNKRCLNFVSRSPVLTPCAVSCPECHMDVCSGCKSRAHPGESCDQKVTQAVHALAKEKGWKSCPNCHMIVERIDGCSHMSCRCQQQFCYNCGKKTGRCWCISY